MMSNNNNDIGNCCIHLGWNNEDCCSWSTSSSIPCDKDGKCTTTDYTYCTSYAYSRNAFVYDKTYEITFDIKINDLLTDCKKTIKCKDPIVAGQCLEHVMDSRYDETCYYKKDDYDSCSHVSENSHSINPFLVVCVFINLIVIYCSAAYICNNNQSFDDRYKYTSIV